ncbi:MAG: hypothetical protein KF858_02235 [Candidatus Sumerlaeia bacterium]|nr:hypothetical protein [Candidatus Sumerlaeia bacterium]
MALTKRFALGLAGLLLATGTVHAQLDGWRFNEFGRTTGTAALRGQFIELHHPVANQSITGLSIVVVRTSVTPPYMFAYRVDLNGTATGNFYLVGSSTYTTNDATIQAPPAPADQTEASQIHRPNGIEEFYLVPTASIDNSWTVSTSTAGTTYRFTGAEFNNGADIIDKAYRISQSFFNDHNPPTVDNNGRWIDVATESATFIGWNSEGGEGNGAYRDVDGTGNWVPYEFPATTGNYPTHPQAVTPGASNTTAPPPPPDPDPEVPGIETFENLTNTDPLTGTSTLTGTSYFQTRIFSASPPPSVQNNAPQAFPQGGDPRYITWNSSVDSILEVVEPGGLEGTEETIQMAFALRVDNLSGSDNLLNNIDLFLLTTNTSGTSGGAQLAGLQVFDGTLRMSADNGWVTVVLSQDAFNANSVNNWNDGKWRVLVGRITPSLTIGEPRATWWVVDPDTGDTELLVDVTTLLDATTNEPRANVRTNIVRRAGFGAVIRSAQLPWQAAVSMDHFGLYSLDDHPSAFDLFTAVYNDFASPFHRLAPNAGVLDFGAVQFDTTATETYTIVNEGTLATTINSASLGGGSGFTLLTTGFPINLPARSSLDLEVEFDTTNLAGPQTDTLTITTTTPGQGTITANVIGTAGFQSSADPLWNLYR